MLRAGTITSVPAPENRRHPATRMRRAQFTPVRVKGLPQVRREYLEKRGGHRRQHTNFRAPFTAKMSSIRLNPAMAFFVESAFSAFMFHSQNTKSFPVRDIRTGEISETSAAELKARFERDGVLVFPGFYS